MCVWVWVCVCVVAIEVRVICGKCVTVCVFLLGRHSLLVALIFHLMLSHSSPTISRRVGKRGRGLSRESNAGVHTHIPLIYTSVLQSC